MSTQLELQRRLSVGMRYLLSLAFANFAPLTFAAADSCSPTFSAIYDFQVGDVFQKQVYSSTSAGGAWPSTRQIRKYSIASKTRDGNKVSYLIRGYSRLEEFQGGLPVPANTRVTYRPIMGETLEFVDSTRHILNLCQDDSVSISNYYPAGQPVGLHTRVRISIGIPPISIPPGGAEPSPRLLKQLGGDGNLYRLAGGTPVDIPPQEVRLEYVYAEGLGLVRYSESRFETVKSESLDGYVREGDTVGTVHPDAYFLDPMTAMNGASPGSGKGRKTQERFQGFLARVANGYAAPIGYDLRGRFLEGNTAGR